MLKKLTAIFLPLIFLLLTACIEFNEVTQLNHDGSVLLTLFVKLPDMSKFKKAEKSQQQDVEEGVEDLMGGLSKSFKLERHETKEQNGVTTFEASISIPSLPQVKELYRQFEFKKKDAKKEVKKGKDAFEEIFEKSEHFKVSKTKEGTLKISRTLKPPKLIAKKPVEKPKEDNKDMEKFGEELEEAFQNMFYFTFEFIPPGEVKSSNATRVVGNTYRWETSLGYLQKNPLNMEIEITETPELQQSLLK